MNKPDKTKTTIYDVAKASGFSTATVSLVMNNDTRIKLSTRRTVMDCVRELNYSPSALARGLANQRTHNIGLIIPNLHNPVFAEMVEGVKNYLNGVGYNIIIEVTQQNLEMEKKYLRSVRNQKVDGLIVFPTFLNEIHEDLIQIQKEKFPIIICGVRMDGEAVPMNYVSSNIIEGAYLATESLIRKGHKKICLMSGEVNNQQSDERIKGYRQALKMYGIPYEEQFVLRSPPHLDTIYQKCYGFIGEHPDVTAFFCLFDYIALAVFKAIQQRGLRVPQDIAMIGYDDIELARFMPVELSSVRTNNYKIGEISARIIYDLLQNPDAEVQQIVLPPILIERESSG